MNKKMLDFSALEQNLNKYNEKKVCAMVKANAYGHGVKDIVEFLKNKISFFGVSSFEEAMEVRQFCSTPIIIVSPCEQIEKCKENSFHFIIQDFGILSKAKKLDALNLGHIKLNTGMNRFGFNCLDNQVIKRLRVELNSCEVGGICTHYSNLHDKKTTQKQYNLFCKVKKFLKVNALVHFGGGEVINYPFDYDMVRVGLGLYVGEKQVMKISSNIIDLKQISTGNVGYEGAYEVKKPTKIALVPVGYADGLVRAYTGSKVLINNQEAKIIGKICMDLCFIDVSKVVCQKGDCVDLFFDVGYSSRFTHLSEYELLTNFNKFRKRE